MTPKELTGNVLPLYPKKDLMEFSPNKLSKVASLPVIFCFFISPPSIVTVLGGRLPYFGSPSSIENIPTGYWGTYWFSDNSWNTKGFPMKEGMIFRSQDTTSNSCIFFVKGYTDGDFYVLSRGVNGNGSWLKIAMDYPSFYKDYNNLASLATALGVSGGKNSRRTSGNINLDSLTNDETISIDGSQFSGTGITDTTTYHYGFLLIVTSYYTDNQKLVFQMFMEYDGSLLLVRSYWPNMDLWITKRLF